MTLLRVGIVHGSDGPRDWADLCARHLTGAPGVELALVIRDDADGAIERMRAARLDVLLDLAGTHRTDAVEPAPRYGVWSFHHGDGEAYAQGPVTRWETHCAEAALHMGLISALGHRVLVLQQGCFARRRAPWPKILAEVLAEVAAWPAKICREAVHLHEDPLARGQEALFLQSHLDRWRGADLLRRAHYQVARLRHWSARRAWRWRREKWAIGIVRAPIHAFLERPRDYAVTWIAEPSRDEYLADPFAARTGTGAVILAEHFDRRTGRGQLCALDLPADLDAGRAGPPRSILSLPAHLSYPFLFELEGRVYCLPEMYQSGGLHLFEALEFPDRWRLVATLLDGVPAVDPVLFRHGGRFWILCTRRDTSHSAKTMLHAWWATTLMGPWTPHARNPVTCDVRSARSAGTPFTYRGELYRPGQDCSKTYGGAVSLNRITRLTPEEYAEEIAVVVRPDPKGPYPAGLHTLSSFGDCTLIDGKRWVWSRPWTSKDIVQPQTAELPPALARLAR